MNAVRQVLSWTLTFLLVGVAAWAQEKAAQPEAPAAPGAVAPQIDAASAFLLAWGKGKWDEARAVAADSVPLKVGDRQATLDVAGGKAGARLVFPFKGLSTVREGGKVTGVAVDEITVKVGEVETTGKGRLTLDEQDGHFRVTGLTVQ